MAKILESPRVYSFLHVPVQSGSDSVLGEMKREYCRKEFEHVVEFLRNKVPGVTIATDIICGFPTETESDFDDTMTMCEKYKFPSLFINQFFPRPGTPAARMERIPANLVKKRTKRLTDLFNSYEPYTHKLNEIHTVLVTEISHDKKHYVGHNKFYEQVLLPMEENLMGKSVKVRITGTTKFSMNAEVVEKESDWKQCSNPNSHQPKIHTESQQTGTYLKTNGVITNEVVPEIENDLSKYLLYVVVAIGFSLVYRFLLKFLQNIF